MTDPEPRRDRPLVSDDVAYVLPMAVFLVCIFIAGKFHQYYWQFYVARAVIVAVLLAVLWRHYTRLRWNGWWLGVIVGVIGFFQWVGMQLWLQAHVTFFALKPD